MVNTAPLSTKRGERSGGSSRNAAVGVFIGRTHRSAPTVGVVVPRVIVGADRCVCPSLFFVRSCSGGDDYSLLLYNVRADICSVAGWGAE